MRYWRLILVVVGICVYVTFLVFGPRPAGLPEHRPDDLPPTWNLVQGSAKPPPTPPPPPVATPAPPPAPSATPAELLAKDPVADFQAFAGLFGPALNTAARQVPELNKIAPNVRAVSPGGIDVVKTDSLIGPLEGRYTTKIVLGTPEHPDMFEMQFRFRAVGGRWEATRECGVLQEWSNRISPAGSAAAEILVSLAPGAAQAVYRARDASGPESLRR